MPLMDINITFPYYIRVQTHEHGLAIPCLKDITPFLHSNTFNVLITQTPATETTLQVTPNLLQESAWISKTKYRSRVIFCMIPTFRHHYCTKYYLQTLYRLQMSQYLQCRLNIFYIMGLIQTAATISYKIKEFSIIFLKPYYVHG